MTLLILVFSEITPKSIAIKYAESYSLAIAGFFTIITKMLNPIVKLLLLTTNLVLKIFGQSITSSEIFITKEELKTIIDVSHDEGVILHEEKDMLKNIFDLAHTRIDDVMTPRVDLIALDIASTFTEVMEVLREETHSKIPIYEDEIDNIKGIFYSKDLLSYDQNQTEFHLKDFIKEPFYVFEFENAKTVFDKLRKNNLPLAIVLDEYGGLAGIVTIEDLLEEIVGNLGDSYDDQEELILFINENTFLVDGSLRIELFNDYFGTNIVSKSFDTIGGLILGEFLMKDKRKTPSPGASKTIQKIKFEIFEMKSNKIENLKVYIKKE